MRQRLATTALGLTTRIAWLAPLLVAVTILVFVGTELAPGDAATHALGPGASEDALDATRAELGLDRPTSQRYLAWLGDLARADLGRSAVSGRPVSDLLAGPAQRTLALAAVTGIGVLVVGVGGGVVAGLSAGGFRDRALSTVALLLLSVPEFVVATVLVVTVALTLGWLPAVSLVPSSGSVWDDPRILVLPAVTGAITAGSYVFRLVRGAVADQAARPHVLAGRLDGLATTRLVAFHLLPGALPQITTALAVTVPYLVGGTVVIEAVFGYPGLGSALVSGVAARDQVLVQAVVLVLATASGIAYVLADLVGALTDPRRHVAIRRRTPGTGVPR